MVLRKKHKHTTSIKSARLEVMQASSASQKSLSKKSWFYRILSPLLILGGCLLLYFGIIVSSAPRSFQFITDKIQQELNSKFDKKASIKDSFLSFTRYGTVKIAIIGLKISYQQADLDNFFQKTEDKYLLIPKIEVEFSLTNLLLLRFAPSKIRIVSPQILIENISHLFAEGPKTADQSASDYSQLGNDEFSKGKMLDRSDENLLGKNSNLANPIQDNKISEIKFLAKEPKFNSIKTTDYQGQNNYKIISNNKEDVGLANKEFGPTLPKPPQDINLKQLNLQQDEAELSAILSFLQKAQEGSYPTENFEIENAKLLFRKNSTQAPDYMDCLDKNCSLEFNEILIKKSSIKLTEQNGNLNFSSKSTIVFDGSSETKLESNCILSAQSDLKCSAQIANLIPNLLSNLSNNLSELKNFNSSINGNFEITAENGRLKYISFKIRGDIGSFMIKDFFADKIEFRNLVLNGDYDHRSRFLNVSKIDVDLLSKIANQTEIGNPHLSASATYSKNGSESQIGLLLNIQNFLNQEIYRFWPKKLNIGEIRDWYLRHMQGGIIKSGYAKLRFSGNGASSMNLDDINAQISFAGFGLEYDKNFPKISNLVGIADFTKNSMKVSLSSGEVLQSRISSAVVAIDDFSAKSLLLKISGESSGNAADGLKHVSNDANFTGEIEKYLNGYSQNKFFVSIPLTQQSTEKDSAINFADCHLQIESAIFGLKNDFAKGDFLVKTEKKATSQKFETEIDLLGLNLDIAELGLTKNTQEPASLKFAINLSNRDQLAINHINLIKNVSVTDSKEQNSSKNLKISAKTDDEKIFGDVVINLAKASIQSLNLTNKGFGKNDYSVSFEQSDEKNIKLRLSGSYMNAGGFFKSKLLRGFFTKNGDKEVISQKIKVSLSRLELFNQKVLRNVFVNLSCYGTICNNGLVQARYLKNRSLQLSLFRVKDKSNLALEGFVNDSGFIAEALNLSKLAAGGDIKFKIREEVNENQEDNKELVKNATNASRSDQNTRLAKKSDKKRFNGELTLESPLTIFENESVKKLSKNTLFSKIKDKIFTSEKTILNSGKADLTIIGDEIIINSMIVNNFKIGITAKGKINFIKGDFSINGMIIPAYIVNSLFGLSKIPIIGSVVSGILTGGEEGGGVFGLRYEYSKKAGQKEGIFTTNKVAAFVPTTIQNLFN